MQLMERSGGARGGAREARAPRGPTANYPAVWKLCNA